MKDIVSNLMTEDSSLWTLDLHDIEALRAKKLQSYLLKYTNRGNSKQIDQTEFREKIIRPVHEYITKEVLPHYKNRFISTDEVKTFETNQTDNNQKLWTRSEIINCLLFQNEYSRGIDKYLGNLYSYIKKYYDTNKLTLANLIQKIEPAFLENYLKEKQTLYTTVSWNIENEQSFTGNLLRFYNDWYPICKRLSTSAAQVFLTHLQK